MSGEGEGGKQTPDEESHQIQPLSQSFLLYVHRNTDMSPLCLTPWVLHHDCQPVDGVPIITPNYAPPHHRCAKLEFQHGTAEPTFKMFTQKWDLVFCFLFFLKKMYSRTFCMRHHLMRSLSDLGNSCLRRVSRLLWPVTQGHQDDLGTRGSGRVR